MKAHDLQACSLQNKELDYTIETELWVFGSASLIRGKWGQTGRKLVSQQSFTLWQLSFVQEEETIQV